MILEAFDNLPTSVNDIKKLKLDNEQDIIDLYNKLYKETKMVDPITIEVNKLKSGTVGKVKISPNLAGMYDITELKAKYDISMSFGNGSRGKKAEKGNLGADEYEKVIAVAYNMTSFGILENEAIKKAGIKDWAKIHSAKLYIGEEIVKSAWGKPSGTMYHYGAGRAELTSEWDDYFIKATGKPAYSATKTPKTDMFTDKGVFISLKEAGGSQLMSGGQGEALATFEFAYDNLNDNIKTDTFNSEWAGMIKDIKTNFIKRQIDGGITNVKKDIKAGKKSKIIDDVRNILANNDRMRKNLRKLLETKEFKMEVVREAMTGNSKFDKKEAIANYIMVFNKVGKENLKIIDDKVVAHYANSTKFDISFKSANGKQWTAMKGISSKGLTFESSDEILETICNEALLETESEFISEISEEYTNEGIKDMFKKAGEFLLSLLLKIFNKIKKIFNSSLNSALTILGADMKVKTTETQFKI